MVPCTGRALGSLSPEVTAIPGITYAVTSNGAAIENLSLGQRIYCNLLDKGTSLSILDTLSSQDIMVEVFIQGKGIYGTKVFRKFAPLRHLEDYIPYVLQYPESGERHSFTRRAVASKYRKYQFKNSG